MPFARVNGIMLHYAVIGSGEPLLLIGGLAMDLRGWALQVRRLCRHYRLILLDNRGAGRSESPPGPYTTRMMAEDAIGLLDSLGIGRTHVAGVSMGGMIAQEMALLHPSRVGKLVLASTFACHHGESGFTDECARQFTLPPGQMRGGIERLVYNRMRGRIFLRALSRASWRKGWETGFKAQHDAVMGHDELEHLARIRSAALVITGDRDRIIRPRSSEEIARRLPAARVVMVEGGSHGMVAEDCGRFNTEVLSFLGGTTRGA
jgi:pimeloyl-ACP methyl ester carboxylesterase